MATPLRDYELIAIAGLANSGKDTLSSMLHYILNAPKCFQTYWWYKHLKKWPFKNKWETVAFAKPLKETLSIILNKPTEWFDDRNNKENCYVQLDTLKVYQKSEIPENCRLSENKFQKVIKSGESIPENLYISIRQLMQYYGTECVRRFLGDKTWINVTLNKQNNKKLIISDLRFKVELIEVYSRKGTVIYVQRNSAKPGTHASEREAVQMLNAGLFNTIINNNGSLEDLFNKIKELC